MMELMHLKIRFNNKFSLNNEAAYADVLIENNFFFLIKIKLFFFLYLRLLELDNLFSIFY